MHREIKTGFSIPSGRTLEEAVTDGKKTTIFLSKLNGEKKSNHTYIQIFPLMFFICLFPLDD